MTEEKLFELVRLGEESELKIHLNRGVASLCNADKSHFRPHLCLNEKEGVNVIKQIASNPDQANTEFLLSEKIIISGDDVWLNTSFVIFFNKICVPTNRARLSPRQTSYIIERLPDESKEFVLEKVKAWFNGLVRPDIIKGLTAIAKQLETGNPLLKNDHENRVFDIHGGRSMEVPYTEWDIIGYILAPLFLFGVTLFDHERDGYEVADGFLADSDRRQKETAEDMINLMRILRQ